MPLAIYETNTSDPIAKAGRTIARLARRHDDLASFAHCIAALEDQILSGQAQSLEGAMAQLLVAFSRYRDKAGADEELDQATLSILRAMSAVCRTRPTTLGGNYYLCNPEDLFEP